MIFSWKNTLIDFWYHGKIWYYPKKYGISSDRKIKDDKRVYLYKKVPIIICTFMESFIDVFIRYFTIKKTKTGNSILGLKFDFFFKSYAWRHSTMNNIQYSIPFIQKELHLRVCLSLYWGNILFIRGWVLNLKIVRAVTDFFSVQVGRNFLMVRGKNLVKVDKIGEVIF